MLGVCKYAHFWLVRRKVNDDYFAITALVRTLYTFTENYDLGVFSLCIFYFVTPIFRLQFLSRILAHSAETGDSLWMLDNAHAGGVTALVLSHNRRFLLSGGPAGEVRLWEMRSRELISHLKEHKQKVTALCLFEDDTLCLSGSRDRCVLRWDLKSEVHFFLFLSFLCVLST